MVARPPTYREAAASARHLPWLRPVPAPTTGRSGSGSSLEGRPRRTATPECRRGDRGGTAARTRRVRSVRDPRASPPTSPTGCRVLGRRIRRWFAGSGRGIVRWSCRARSSASGTRPEASQRPRRGIASRPPPCRSTSACASPRRSGVGRTVTTFRTFANPSAASRLCRGSLPYRHRHRAGSCEKPS